MSLLNGFLPQPQDSQGRTLPYAQIWTYNVGTLTPKVVYQDAALTIPASNPVVADGSGVFSFYLGSGGYRLILKDQYGTTIRDQDNYYSNLTGSDLTNINNSIAAVDQNLSGTMLICHDSGVADHYVLDPLYETPLTAYRQGMIVTFTPVYANTGACDANICSLGVLPMVTGTLAPLPAGFLQPFIIYQFVLVGGYLIFFAKTGVITSVQVPNGLITGTMIANNTITNTNVVNNTIGPTQITTGSGYTYIGRGSGGSPTDLNIPVIMLSNTSIPAAASFEIDLGALDLAANDQNYYLIRVFNALPATNDTKLYATFYNSTASAYSAANYSYITTGNNSAGGSEIQNGAAAAQAVLCGDGTAGNSMSNAAAANTFFDIYLSNFNSTTQGLTAEVHGMISFGCGAGGGKIAVQNFSAFNLTGGTAVWSKIKFAPSAGNWQANGRYIVYKLNRSL